MRAGTRLVWVLYPFTRTVTVYRSPEDAQQLAEGDRLDGGEVVPDFSCVVRDVFD